MKNVNNPPNLFTKLVQFLLAVPLFIPLVSAQRIGSVRIPRLIDNSFRSIFNTLGREAVQAGITVLLFFITIYAITLAGVKRVKTFQDGDRVSKSGKIFAFAFSALATLGLFFGTRRHFYDVVRQVLAATSVFGMVALGIILFLLTYYGFKQGDDKYPCAALAAAGLAFILPAYIMQWEGWYSFGWILLIVGAIWCLFKMFRGGSSGGGSGNGNDNSNNSNNPNDPNNPNNPKNPHHGRLIIQVNDATNTNPINGAEIFTERRGSWTNPVNWMPFGWIPEKFKNWYRFEGYTDRGIFELDPTRLGGKLIIVRKHDYVDPKDPRREYVVARSRTVSNQDRTIVVELLRLGDVPGTSIEVNYEYPLYPWANGDVLYPLLSPVNIIITKLPPGTDFNFMAGNYFELVNAGGVVIFRFDGATLRSYLTAPNTYIIPGVNLPNVNMYARFDLN